MLSDEEKKAIKDLMEEIVILKENSEMIIDSKELLKYKETLLNLIEKQSKEIEELKEKNKNLNWYFENQKDNFVHKDKIKAKIEPVLKQLDTKMKEEYNKYGNSREYQDIIDAYNFLQSLLEKE